jgi:hypothetical protein
MLNLCPGAGPGGAQRVCRAMNMNNGQAVPALSASTYVVKNLVSVTYSD